ncbi:MAG: ATP phosphoribosyltransferase [Cyanobacteria bacterium SZAS LIN-5]|nr:ATP phosphoribosyltransferase [Cyanobacteria bacterium SZAS LIN-5]RTL42696.1 MAG: ATP phosphoribosyltransferase [Candidatus Melainabacteria bacterium]
MSNNQTSASTKGSLKRSEDGAGNAKTNLRLTIPKGRIQEKVMALLGQIGMNFLADGRSYRPLCSDPYIVTKLLKSQNIPSLVALGRHDCGFSGYDWIVEQDADVVELLDLNFDPVRIVAAMPEDLVGNDDFKTKDFGRKLIVASEYKSLTQRFIERNKLNAIFVQTFGATEALPPEDADVIVDNTSTGTTLKHNRLVIVEELMRSTTRFICNKQALEDPIKRKMLEEMTMLMKSTLLAKQKVMLEMNVSRDDFERVVSNLPCMRAPTISELYNGDGYAIKIAVPVKDVPDLIPTLVSLGARDILEYKVEKIVAGYDS